MIAPLTAACMAAVIEAYSLPAPDFWTILDHEHGRIGQVVQTSNKTVDIRPFHINSIEQGQYLRHAWAHIIRERARTGRGGREIIRARSHSLRLRIPVAALRPEAALQQPAVEGSESTPTGHSP